MDALASKKISPAIHDILNKHQNDKSICNDFTTFMRIQKPKCVQLLLHTGVCLLFSRENTQQAVRI